MVFLNNTILYYFFLLFSSVANTQHSKVVAFLGAEVYGRFTTGGRGDEVILVSNLNDSGEGSLRAAIEKKGPRIILFEIAGNIDLKSPLNLELEAGQIKMDSDKNGMPDEWELTYQLDPINPQDANQRQFNKYYDNIEVYLNQLVKEITKRQKGKEAFLPREEHNIEQAYDYVVDASGEGDFKKVQEAFMAVPDFRSKPTRIYIKKGIYKEKLVLPDSKTNVHLIGEEAEETILTYDDYASKENLFGEEMGTTGSSSFFVFGDGFRASNLTFENSAGPVGQAVAIRIDGDKVMFENCRFLGFQDTLYLYGRNSRQYYKNCYIEGTTDFIFGWSIAVFEDCEIFSKKGGHYITAASTQEDAAHGFVFINCALTGDAPEESVYLGRPWRDHAQTVFLNTRMGEHIKAEGWHNWNKPEAEETAFYGEYNSSGPGAAPDQRVEWSHQFSAEQAAEYTVETILEGEDNWQPNKKP